MAIFFLCVFITSARADNHSPEKYKYHFNSIPSHAWGDLKQSFWGLNGLAFVLGTGASLAFIPADKNISHHFRDDPLFSRKFDKDLGWVLSPYTVGGASAIAFLVGIQVHNPRFSLAAESAFESWVGTMAITTAAKFTVRRERPNGGNYSFPSAHSGAVFSLAAVLTDFYGWPAAIPSYAAAGFVAFTRIDGQYHNLSDVLVGATLGTVMGLGTSQFHKKKNPQFFIAPQVSSHETGLTFSKTF